MIIVQSGSKCSCENMDDQCKCQKCDTVFCFKCLYAFVITDAYTKLERQERCCPECHSINLKLLN
jgi:Zn finger protein HypA/HybF involved in hydrogenase expression